MIFSCLLQAGHNPRFSHSNLDTPPPGGGSFPSAITLTLRAPPLLSALLSVAPACSNVPGPRALRPVLVSSPTTSCTPQPCNPDPHLTRLPSLQPRPLSCSTLTATRGRPRLAAGFPGQPVIWQAFKVCSALWPGRWVLWAGVGQASPLMTALLRSALASSPLGSHSSPPHPPVASRHFVLLVCP